ncbi:hypothetical protein Taro_028349 [Colocasia esculenta]|uniref:Peptidase metallopeptidase domain-containing protein n=1 Tax=Colocasia esculenta TaxID=4460 RepID=A0A843VQ61_COLES|nr:hypothetical protein [Colocasia esculenta]
MPPTIIPLLVLSLLLLCPPESASRPVRRGQLQEEQGEEEVLIVVNSTRVGGGGNNDTAWRAFERFLDAERGSHVGGMSELKRYFHRFGYFSSNLSVHVGTAGVAPGGGHINFTDAFDESFEAAVALYQSNLGLPVTRKLDAATLAQIMSPRCGVDDRDMRRRRGRNRTVRRYNFFPGQPTWARARPMTLTYAFSPTNFIDYVPRADVQAAFRRAFARWAAVIPVSFVEVQDFRHANIKVGFYDGDHGDGEPFDGMLGVLAHAFSPENGRLHLDAAETWAVDFHKQRSDAAVDLESEAIMYPSLSPRTRKVELRVDDVEGVQLLYGSNPNFRLDALLASDTSSAAPSSRGPGSKRTRALGLVRRGCMGALAAALCTVLL